MTKRWFRYDVDTLTHPIVGAGLPGPRPADPSRPCYSRHDAWLWMLAHARWQAGDINNNGRRERMEVGQVLAGQAYLARQWNWTEKAVRKFLEKLRSEGMVDWGKTDGHFTKLVTICNYASFQDVKSRNNRPSGQVRGKTRAGQGLYKYKEHQEHHVSSEGAPSAAPPLETARERAGDEGAGPSPAKKIERDVVVNAARPKLGKGTREFEAAVERATADGSDAYLKKLLERGWVRDGSMLNDAGAAS